MSDLEMRVYTPDAQTITGWITEPIEAAFSDEFNGAGTGSVTVPLDGADAKILVKDAVVRVFYKSKCVYAWYVETLDRTLVGVDERRVLTASGRGLLGWLDDAVVYPQGGFLDYANPDRQFNFASGDGTWLKAAGYKPAIGVKWRQMTGIRKGQPKGWPDPDAEWIWTTDPLKPVKAGETGWFRSTFTLDKSERVRFWVTADNRYEVFLDGAPLLTQTASNRDKITWTEKAVKTMRVGKGVHTVAARVQNEKPFQAENVVADADTDTIDVGDSGLAKNTVVRIGDVDKKDSGLKAGEYYVAKATDTGIQISEKPDGAVVKWAKSTRCNVTAVQDNSAAFLLTASVLDDNNRPSRVVERTSGTGWLAAAQEPQWLPALILWTMIREAQSRGVSRLDRITRSWNDDKDSSNVPWTTDADVTIPCGTSLANVFDQVVDLGIDFWIDPATVQLAAWEQRGSDMSGTVRLDVGQELTAFATQEERNLRTAALVRTKDGWTESRTAGVDQYGRRETMVQYDRTRSETTGRKLALKALERLGKRRIVANTVTAKPTARCEPYTHFTVGDIIALPSSVKTGYDRARVLSITMNGSDDVTYSLELEVLDV